ncbi:DUF305 domain-containing protein [Phytohabitans sp. ZYX-F-186]|uniref:DUF305 domain-containing protein n=1 Tax=Phytohabitans maris TaxID=3071409 RepID=A0ABU0ZR74_9ACTN|nr:DUF305 domain-containing protein [Phytohabitans sp. ZYX-F-186]MDQ7909473.1 DUF305 domain-containing protein [Phytohabitans sp. ZYX-F-186]
MRRVLFAAATALLLATGCSTEPSPPPAAPADAAQAADTLPAADAEHNAADVMFLQMMVAHDGQGLELTGLAADRTVSEEVRLLAAAIDTTQREEVKIMQSWLTGWKEATEASQDMSAHASHGGLPATGPEQIEALRNASDADFEATFLNLLTGHQNSAVELTNLAADGVNPQTKDLAKRIKESRADQVAQMLRLIGG